jgi:hypothetical protein
VFEKEIDPVVEWDADMEEESLQDLELESEIEDESE